MSGLFIYPLLFIILSDARRHQVPFLESLVWFDKTHHYKVWIKSKWSNRGEGVATSPTSRCSCYWKENLWSANLLNLYMNYFLYFQRQIFLYSGKLESPRCLTHFDLCQPLDLLMLQRLSSWEVYSTTWKRLFAFYIALISCSLFNLGMVTGPGEGNHWIQISYRPGEEWALTAYLCLRHATRVAHPTT